MSAERATTLVNVFRLADRAAVELLWGRRQRPARKCAKDQRTGAALGIHLYLDTRLRVPRPLLALEVRYWRRVMLGPM